MDKRKWLTPDRVLYILNVGAMTFAMVLNIKVAIPYISVMPYMNVIKAMLNAFCVCLSIILIIHPEKSS